MQSGKLLSQPQSPSTSAMRLFGTIGESLMTKTSSIKLLSLALSTSRRKTFQHVGAAQMGNYAEVQK